MVRHTPRKRTILQRRSRAPLSVLPAVAQPCVQPSQIKSTAEGAGCESWCAEEYAAGRRPSECGHWRWRENGTTVYDNTPVARGCQSKSAEHKHRTNIIFEPDDATTCDLWGRAFSRFQLLQILVRFAPERLEQIAHMSKKDLCGILHDSTLLIFRELETAVHNWCRDLSADLEAPQMEEVFRSLSLPPPRSYGVKNLACAALVSRLSQVRPSWSDRSWHALKAGTRAVWDWIRRNPAKSLVLAASFIASVYGIPYLVAAQSALGTAVGAITNKTEAKSVLPLAIEPALEPAVLAEANRWFSQTPNTLVRRQSSLPLPPPPKMTSRVA